LRERLCVVEAQIRRLEREKHMLLNHLFGASTDVIDGVLQGSSASSSSSSPLPAPEKCRPECSSKELQGGGPDLHPKVTSDGEPISANLEEGTSGLAGSMLQMTLWQAAQGQSVHALMENCDGRTLHPSLAPEVVAARQRQQAVGSCREPSSPQHQVITSTPSPARGRATPPPSPEVRQQQELNLASQGCLVLEQQCAGPHPLHPVPVDSNPALSDQDKCEATPVPTALDTPVDPVTPMESPTDALH